MYIFLNKKNRQKGAAALISVIFFLIISLVIISSFVFIATSQAQVARDLINSKRAIAAAESGLEEASLILGNNEGASPQNFSITYDDGAVPVSFVAVGTGVGTEYQATGIAGGVLRRTGIVDTRLTINIEHASFAGTGGILMENNSGISNGGVYANGPIIGNGSNTTIFDVRFGGSNGRVISEEKIDNLKVDQPEDPSCLLDPVVIAPEIEGSILNGYPVACGENNGSTLQCGDAFCEDEPFSLSDYDADLIQFPEEDPNTQEFLKIKNPLQGQCSGTTDNLTNKAGLVTEGSVCIRPSGGPGGTFTIQNQGQLFLTGNAYVDGDLELKDACQIFALGDHRIIVVDGKITVKNTCNVTGVGADNEDGLDSPGSEYILHSEREDEYKVAAPGDLGKLILVALGEDDEENTEDPREVAFRIQGGAKSPRASVVYAPYGTVLLQNNTQARGAFAKRVWIENNAVLYYASYLEDLISESSGELTDWREIK